MFNTLEECKNAWESAGQHGSIQDRIERNARWMHYYRFMAKQYEGCVAEYDAHAADVVRHLENAGLLQSDTTVLDIGAGTGAYSLAFARRCAAVSALDMDGASLGVLADHAKQLGLYNVQRVQGMWEEYETNKAFSLTFCSLCPAICSYEDLLKMESLTTQTCCLVAVARGSYDLHRTHLMRLLSAKPTGGMTSEALWYYEMLYLMGRQPDVWNWTVRHAYAVLPQQACLQYEMYFELFGIPAAQSRPVLAAYFESVTEDGFVHDLSHLNLALICWNVGNARAPQ